MVSQGWFQIFKILTCLLLACAAGRVAHAAPSKPASIGTVQFGYANSMPLERWGPVRVSIVSHGPAFTGRLLLRYRQDLTQSQVISVPASVGPSSKVPVELVAAFPQGPDEITLQLQDSDGYIIDSARFGRIDGQAPADLAKFPADQLDGVIGFVGRNSAVGTLNSRWFGSTIDPWAGLYDQGTTRPPPLAARRLKRGARLHGVGLSAAELPHQWAAYDGLEALVIRSEEVNAQIDPDVRTAILRWVQGGGRLVLMVDQAGEEWRQWLPPELAAGIQSSGLARIAVPASLAAALQRPVLEDAVTAREGADPNDISQLVPNPAQPQEPKVLSPAEGIPADLAAKLLAAESFTTRTFRLSPAMADQAWATAWSGSDGAVIVQGPVGFGYITILGCDPHLAAAVPNREATYRLWLSVLDAPLEDWLSSPELSANLRSNGWWGAPSSGANEFQRQSLVRVLNALAGSPSVRFNPFVVLGAVLICILVLAVLIGPLDAVLLRLRGARQFSWLTALGWIGLMSVAAMFAPTIFRGNLHTVLLRQRVVDHLPDGTVWSAAAGGIFAGFPGEHPLQVQFQPRFLRGVGVTSGYSARSRESFPPIRAELGNHGTVREAACVPEAFEQSQWTLRTFVDDGPEDSDPTRLSATAVWNDDRLIVTVRSAALVPDLADGITVSTSDSLRTWRSHSAVPVRSSGAGPPQWQLVFSDVEERPNSLPASLDDEWLAAWPSLNSPVFPPEQHLPGAQRRLLGIESRLRSGKFALLTLNWSMPMNDMSLPGAAAAPSVGTVHRLLIALPPRTGPHGATP